MQPSAHADADHLIDDQRAVHGWAIWAQRRGYRPRSIQHRRHVLGVISRQLPAGLIAATEDDLSDWDMTALAGMALNTRRSYIGALHTFYAYAVDYRLVAADPSRRLVAPKNPRTLPRPLPSTPTMDAIDSLVPGRERLTLMLMIGSGLRSCEVANLRRNDIVNGREGPLLDVREGKGGHERIVPIPEWLATEITAHGGKHIVVEALRGGPLSASGIQSIATRGLADAGVEGTPHQLRHTYLTELYELTYDIRFVQECAGHQSPTTTAGYVARTHVGRRDAIEKLPRPASSSGLRVVS